MSRAEQAARPHSAREVEQKFRVHGLFRIPDLSTLAGVSAVDDLGVVELESAYYDTEDLRLAREGITLRRRTGDDEGWHLKLPAGAVGTRDELRLPLDDRDAPPAALAVLVRVITRTQPLRLVSTLRTTRARQLIRSDGKDAGELVDDTVHVVGSDGAVAARFRELELEERDGGPLIGTVATALTEAGAVGGEFVAKVVRALGPNAAAPPEVPELPVPKPKDPAHDTLVAYLSLHVRALRAADVAFRREPADPEAVHQLRVAARRLRSGLRTFRPLLDRPWAEELRAELAWFARALGELREGDVLRERLDRHCADLPPDLPAAEVKQLLADVLGGTVADARTRVGELLDDDRYLALHDRLVRAVARPRTAPDAERPARDVLPALVEKAWAKLDGAADDLTDDAPDDEWHAARLAAKRTRYAAEAVAPVLGGDAKAFAKQVEKVTEILGEHQDAAMAAAKARELANAEPASTDVAFALGVLASNERAYVHAARAAFADTWPHVRRAKWRRWMET
ncbi:CYTH and CHAD domain-containing protein [Jiangella alkaliphila]|uniref:CHAD domain-containing protein n=1 Tax=Jiangella alkaliphila TaxID=419479 RepID=A0A1H2FW16_9ACTN|nr:CYTH and CHAD domain-containing protein [Jiangella alkaliphila]SDU11516.1 CHAD domain-containing protein [Jiangella alkaliphila]